MVTWTARATALPRPQLHRHRLLLLLPGLVVLLPVAALVLIRRFDGLYGQDAFAYYDYAVGPLRQSLLALRVVPPPEFYWPPGFPALVAIVSLALGTTPLAAQLVSLVMGTVAAVATAALTREPTQRSRCWPAQLLLPRPVGPKDVWAHDRRWCGSDRSVPSFQIRVANPKVTVSSAKCGACSLQFLE
jgi:hypothetical protein